MALHPAKLPPGPYDQHEVEAGNKTGAPAQSVNAQPISGHDGLETYRVPLVTDKGLLATDGSKGVFPVTDDYSRRLREREFLDRRAQWLASLDPDRGSEVR